MLLITALYLAIEVPVAFLLVKYFSPWLTKVMFKNPVKGIIISISYMIIAISIPILIAIGWYIEYDIYMAIYLLVFMFIANTIITSMYKRKMKELYIRNFERAL